MELRELRSFIVLAEQLHFARAARLLHLSQPALTKQIQRLEDELGSRLFERTKAGTKLSTFGQRFIFDARGALNGVDHLLERSQQEAKGESGLLRIGSGVPATAFLTNAVARMRLEAPGVEIQILGMSSEEQISGLYERRIDAAFGRMLFPSAFKSLKLYSDRAVLITQVHASPRESMSLRECKDRPFVCISERYSPGFFHHMIRLCARHGFHPRIVQQVPDYSMAVALVEEGLGVTIIPASLWSPRFALAKCFAIPDREAGWTGGVGWRKSDSNPAVNRFLEVLRSGPSGRPMPSL